MDTRSTFAENSPPPPPSAEEALVSTSASIKEAVLEEKKRSGPFLQRTAYKLADYFRRIGQDYAVVAKDVLEDTRRRPLKALAVGGLLAAATFAYKTNPDERALRSQLAELRQQMTLLPAGIHSKRADSKLEHLTSLANTNRLDYYNCCLFSLVVERPDNRKCNLYSTQDKNMKDWWWKELYRQTIDVGALNRFWNLEQALVNYDVREEDE